jgi:hypothetical protein
MEWTLLQGKETGQKVYCTAPPPHNGIWQSRHKAGLSAMPPVTEKDERIHPHILLIPPVNNNNKRMNMVSWQTPFHPCPPKPPAVVAVLDYSRRLVLLVYT